VSYQPSDLQFLRCEYFEGSVETHKQVIVAILVKDTSEGLPVHGRREAVCQDHVAAGGVGESLHFEQTDLVETSGENIDNVAIVCDALREVVIELGSVRQGSLKAWGY
jgi:hypothetical protein